VQWSDLLDARMLAIDNDVDSEGPDTQPRDKSTPIARIRETSHAGASRWQPTLAGSDFDVNSLSASASEQNKRRSRRRRRHQVKAGMSDAGTTATRGSASTFSTPLERDDALDFFYSHQVPSKFAGLSTHCDNTFSPAAKSGRNVVTVNDILGQDSLCQKASSSQISGTAKAPQMLAMPACTISNEYSACQQTDYCAWMETQMDEWSSQSCEAGDRTAWLAPLVTPWNPPYWESTVYSPNDQAAIYAYQAEPVPDESLMSWLVASGVTACDKNDLAEQLRAVAPQAYED